MVQLNLFSVFIKRALPGKNLYEAQAGSNIPDQHVYLQSDQGLCNPLTESSNDVDSNNCRQRLDLVNLVPVLVLLFVALWFILRGDLLYVFPCVILFLCFFSPFSIAITSRGEERANLSAFRTFVQFVLV